MPTLSFPVGVNSLSTAGSAARALPAVKTIVAQIAATQPLTQFMVLSSPPVLRITSQDTDKKKPRRSGASLFPP
jgi:hypothetical protein